MGRTENVPDAFGPCRSVNEKERHVRTEFRGHCSEFILGKGLVFGIGVEPAEQGRAIRAAASQACSHGDSLGQCDKHAGLEAGGLSVMFPCLVDQVGRGLQGGILRAAHVEMFVVGRFYMDQIAQGVHGQEQCFQLMETIVPWPENPEVKVYLGRGNEGLWCEGHSFGSIW